MNGYPRPQLQLPPHAQYGSRQTIPFHTGWFGYGQYDNGVPMPQSYFGTGRVELENEVVSGYHSEQPSKHMPNAVQSYLDINCNENSGNTDLVEQDLSSSMSFFHCEQCKKSFQDKNSLGAHLKSHVKCEFPNCSFVASRQTLKLHEIQCHRDGKMKIVLDTPEEIAKWREERKRNYPSVTNVARKEAEHQRRIESGQTIKTKEFRYNRKQGWKQQRGKRDYKRGRNIQGRSNGPSTEFQHVKFPTTDLLHEEQKSKCILRNENVSDSKDTECDRNEIKETAPLSNLGALAAAYATSSCDEEENDGNDLEQKEDIEKPSPSEQCQKPEFKKQKLTEINDKNVDKDEKRKDSQDSSRRKRKQNIIGTNRPRPTLLEMLLAPDIRHERNVMLQCIRFIIKKNFFGIE